MELGYLVNRGMKAYADEVNYNRSIVDISGLKRVQLRILYVMYKMKLFPDKAYGKCAEIIGSVISTVHPHGDASVYDALVRMSCPWIMNYPLIDFHGSNGTDDGDKAAAYRYTGARLSKYGLQLIEDIEKTGVPFEENYMENGEEPLFAMPSFPALFCNVSLGIGVAAACKFLPHSLATIRNAVDARIKGATEDEIVKNLAPSFPNGGIIVNGLDLPQIYKTGTGSVLLRAKYKESKDGIVFYELPYMVSRTTVINQLKDLGYTAFDITDAKAKGILVKCKKEDIPTIFKKTRLEERFNVNMTIHNRSQLQTYSFIKLLDLYIEQQHMRIINTAKYDQEVAAKKKHELEGIIIVFNDIDKAIEIIKGSENKAQASLNLRTEFNIDAEQAEVILRLTLSRLVKQDIEKINQDIANLELRIAELIEVISDKYLRAEMIVNEISSQEMPKMEILQEEATQTGKKGLKQPYTYSVLDGRLYITDGGAIKPDENIYLIYENGKGFKLSGKDLQLGINNIYKENLMFIIQEAAITNGLKLNYLQIPFDILKTLTARGRFLIKEKVTEINF